MSEQREWFAYRRRDVSLFDLAGATGNFLPRTLLSPIREGMVVMYTWEHETVRLWNHLRLHRPELLADLLHPLFGVPPDPGHEPDHEMLAQWGRAWPFTPPSPLDFLSYTTMGSGRKLRSGAAASIDHLLYFCLRLPYRPEAMAHQARQLAKTSKAFTLWAMGENLLPAVRSPADARALRDVVDPMTHHHGLRKALTPLWDHPYTQVARQSPHPIIPVPRVPPPQTQHGWDSVAAKLDWLALGPHTEVLDRRREHAGLPPARESDILSQWSSPSPLLPQRHWLPEMRRSPQASPLPSCRPSLTKHTGLARISSRPTSFDPRPQPLRKH